MKVLDKKQLALAEIKPYLNDSEEKKILLEYLKKFTKLDKTKAKSLSEEIRALNNAKINEAGVIALINFLPKDQEEINKIFSDVSLSEEEINQILNIIKKYGA